MEDSKQQDYVRQFYLDCGFGTRALHAGDHVGQPHTSSHAGPIYQTSTFVFESAEEGAAVFAGQRPGFMYTRLGNPTVMALEAKVNALEGAAFKLAHPERCVASLAFSSGMAATSALFLAACRQGDTVVVGDMLYGATHDLCHRVLKPLGIKTVEVDTSRLDALETALRQNPQAKLLFFETPANPTLKLTDIRAVSALARRLVPGIHVAVDNTFATPFLQRPLEMGADVVVHSTTKYICGHGVVVGGMVTTVDDGLKDALYRVIKDVGSSPSPFDAWLVNVGLKTLPIRMKAHCANAMAVAKMLAAHPKVAVVHYPGLESHPQHALAREQMADFGGIVSFELKGGLEAGRKMMNGLRLWTLAVSLGTVDSLVQHPASMTHACVPKEEREKHGLTDGLVRLSVGIEEKEDLLASLADGLERT
jgi:methionine-gamma-lyase